MKRFNTRNTVLTRNAPEHAFLVAVESRETTGRGSVKASIDELALLTGTAGASVVGRIIQKLPAPTRTHYVGKGKLEELTATRVELAQHQYLLPRLAGQWSHLERLGGGIGTRGPGESQLETDRRLISRKIHRLKTQIKEVRKHRALYRQKRLKSGISVVSLVGYTNSGKSTLLNALCQAGVFTEGKLFATLDPTTRRLMLPDGKTILITDTVGFIRKLPPAIITAFRATLEELDEAALLLHVVDLSSPDAAEQCQTVEDILADLNLTGKPRITALNKIDLLLTDDRKWDEESAVQYLADQSAGEKA
ncbi:MAG: GTPase HflX, partial [Dehalococcoidia bacterium]|nr:GTPase HflX [Dehalococcoidia bacterium]